MFTSGCLAQEKISSEISNDRRIMIKNRKTRQLAQVSLPNLCANTAGVARLLNSGIAMLLRIGKLAGVNVIMN